MPFFFRNIKRLKLPPPFSVLESVSVNCIPAKRVFFEDQLILLSHYLTKTFVCISGRYLRYNHSIRTSLVTFLKKKEPITSDPFC